MLTFRELSDSIDVVSVKFQERTLLNKQYNFSEALHHSQKIVHACRIPIRYSVDWGMVHYTTNAPNPAFFVPNVSHITNVL